MIDALIIGRSLPALQTALDLAEVGLRVVVAPAVVPEPIIEQPERDTEGAIQDLVGRVAEQLSGVEPTGHRDLTLRRLGPTPVMLQGRAGAWLWPPEPNVWGIPAVPLAGETIALLGTAGALRAYRDRIAPVLTVGKTRSLGELVRRRLGRAATALLVEPLVRERFGVAAADVEVAAAAPGLNEALTRTGSLTAATLAYSERHVDRETAVVPVSGWDGLHAELTERLRLYEVRDLGAAVTAIEPRDGGQWRAYAADGTEIDARALVIDGAPDQHEHLLSAFEDGPRPTATRIHAEISIQTSPGESSGDETLRTVGQWSVRDLGDGRVSVRSARCAPDTAPEQVRQLDALGGSAEFRAAAGAEWDWELRAAPYVAVREREQAAARLQEFIELQPTVLPVGRALHGDDLSLALAAAHREAIALRRRLLGLSE